MRTLIELYDEKPYDNVLATETFRPERTVYICPPGIARDTAVQSKLKEYFAHRGVDTKLEFVRTSMLNTDFVARTIRKVLRQYPDCSINISGGTDAALFAAGMVCSEFDTSAFTYSRHRNRFFEIKNAAFAVDVPCDVHLTIEDCILMAGGSMFTGRVNNDILSNYNNIIDPFFKLFIKERKDWVRIVNYFQRASRAESDGEAPLSIEAPYTVKGDRGSIISAPESTLKALRKIGMITHLDIDRGNSIKLTFADRQMRTWLRDIGAVLELYIYKMCRDTGLFDDVRTSVVVHWSDQPHAVQNEIDVMATSGVMPLFISCKTCDVKTEALNELAILRDRFGGKMAKAAIVTAESAGSPVRMRAAELGIDVIDIADLTSGGCRQRLRTIARGSKL